MRKGKRMGKKKRAVPGAPPPPAGPAGKVRTRGAPGPPTRARVPKMTFPRIVLEVTELRNYICTSRRLHQSPLIGLKFH